MVYVASRVRAPGAGRRGEPPGGAAPRPARRRRPTGTACARRSPTVARCWCPTGPAGTARARPPGWPATAEAILALLERLGLERVTLAGHSFGGAIACWVAAIAPERIGSLVLAAPAANRASLFAVDRWLATPVLGSVAAATVLGSAGLVLSSRRARQLVAARADMPEGYLRGAGRSLRAPRAWRAFAVEQQALLRELPQLERRLGDITAPTHDPDRRRGPGGPGPLSGAADEPDTECDADGGARSRAPAARSSRRSTSPPRSCEADPGHPPSGTGSTSGWGSGSTGVAGSSGAGTVAGSSGAAGRARVGRGGGHGRVRHDRCRRLGGLRDFERECHELSLPATRSDASRDRGADRRRGAGRPAARLGLRDRARCSPARRASACRCRGRPR